MKTSNFSHKNPLKKNNDCNHIKRTQHETIKWLSVYYCLFPLYIVYSNNAKLLGFIPFGKTY